MKYHPHKYQTYASEFIKDHNEAAVFLDCGLGKTSITLTALNDLMFDSFEFNKVLIIAPLRVAKVSWPDEIKKWDHLSLFNYSLVVGTEKERREALAKKADLYIINRENVEWLIEKSNYNFDFDCIVIDELSSFKSYRSKRVKSLLKVRPYVKRIIGLTGSPCGNGLMDLWAEFRVLDMGKRLGRFITNYRNDYFMPDKRNNEVIFSYKPLPGAEDAIYRKISDMTISMKSTDYLDMPELISNEYKVYLSDKEMKIYEEFKSQYVMEISDKEITAANAASLTNRLSQLANGAIYDDDKNITYFHDKKLDALEDLIEASNGKPVLVAYWFKHDLERIKTRLDKIGVAYDVISSVDSIRHWNEGKLEVGLINPASCGHGVNLQEGGSTIIWFGLTWSLELYEQTIARLWRQGQKSRTVVVEHIVAVDTVDESILKALKAKDKTQSALIEAVKAEIKRR